MFFFFFHFFMLVRVYPYTGGSARGKNTNEGGLGFKMGCLGSIKTILEVFHDLPL